MAQASHKGQGRVGDPAVGPTARSTGTHFTPHEQARQLLLNFSGRWLITAAVCGAFSGVLKAYDQRAYLEDIDTNIYNAATAGLTITLSLNLDASLNAFAAAFKWIILAHSPFLPNVFDLILAFDSSKLKALRLIWHGRWGLRIICIVWLLVALGAQVATALIGLTYAVSPLSGDTGEFPNIIGEGSTANFTNIGFLDWRKGDGSNFPEPGDNQYDVTSQRATAFAYGVGAVGSGYMLLMPGDDFSPRFYSVTFDTESKEYISAISNYPSWGANSWIFTEWNILARRVQSYATCERLQIMDRTNSSDETAITFRSHNGTQVLIIPVAPLDYTTYISDTNHSCGARCTQVYSIFSAQDGTDLFLCNSTVGLMFDSVRNDIAEEKYSLPDTQARILAGAIGWGDLDIDSVLNGIPTIGRFQGSSFPNGSFWTPPLRPDEDTISDGYIAHFTAAVISVYDQYGPFIISNDLLIPGQASQLNVTWEHVSLVLILIPGLQAVFALVCIFVVYYFGVPIHDDSPVAMAALLASVPESHNNMKLRYVVDENEAGYRYRVATVPP